MRSLQRPEGSIGIAQIVLVCGGLLPAGHKSAVPDTVVGEVVNSTLQHIKPGARIREEVQMDPRIPPKTGLHAKCLCVPLLPRRRCRSRSDEVLIPTF